MTPSISPRYCSTSVPQMPHASTRRIASSRPTFGRGSSTSSIARAPVWMAAVTVPVIATGLLRAPERDLAARHEFGPPIEGLHPHAGVAFEIGTREAERATV